MDWEGLDAFVLFSDELNFTRAAHKMHISQPALHTKIKRLGERLGVQLYHREGRKLILTPAGERVARFGREQKQRTHSFLTQLKQGAHTEPVILTAGSGAYLYILGSGIREYIRSKQAPLQLHTGNQKEVLQAIRTGKTHVGVAVLEHLPNDICTQRLYTAYQGLVCPKEHPLAQKQHIQPSDLQGIPLILPPADRLHRQTIERICLESSIQLNIAVEASGWELMMHFVSLGLGFTIVNSCCTLPPGSTLLPIPALPKLHYFLLYTKEAYERSDVRMLIQTLLCATRTPKEENESDARI